ncbi:MAG: hypothetical protein WD063_00330 [Pirellulales bacterium]
MDFALVDHASEQYLGQWKRLVSTTNWEKGRIVHQWRLALAAADAPTADYSDDAWSRRVGNVTPQHVGRLRRVFERFAAQRDDYPGLYWSHFQAALDWDDAELWLEGAVQNEWSISEMRHKRWETRGALAAEDPDDDDAAIEAPLDEDADAAEPAGDVSSGTLDVVEEPDRLGNQEDDDEAGTKSRYESRQAFDAAVVRPFAALPPLPPDVNDAFEAYKLCILRHKMAGWQEISRDDLLASLDGLVQLALAPADL